MGKCRGALRSCTTLPKRTDPLAKSRRRRKMPMRPWMVSSSRGGAASSRRIRGQVGNCAKLQEVGWEPGGISQNAARACVWRGFFAISAFLFSPGKLCWVECTSGGLQFADGFGWHVGVALSLAPPHVLPHNLVAKHAQHIAFAQSVPI